MRVWTDGKTHLVVENGRLRVYAPGKPPAVRAVPGAAPDVADPARKAGRGRELLAARAGGSAVWLGSSGQRCQRLSLTDSTPPASLAWRFLDLAAIDDERVLAAMVGAGKKPVTELVAGPIPEEGASWNGRLELPTIAKAQWPALVWSKIPWSRKNALGERVHITHGELGSAVADRDTGIVAVLRPGAEKVDFALRVPTQDAAEVFAAATNEGVLVSVCVGGRESAVCHFDREGRLLGSLGKLGGVPCVGMGPPAVVDAAHALVTSADEKGRMAVLALPSLEEAGVLDVGFEVTGEQSVSIAPGGLQVAFGFGAQAWVARRGDEDSWELDQLPIPQTSATKAEPKAPAALERIKGPPSLTLLPQRDAPRVWSARSGETIEIELRVASTGGAGAGVYVEVSGPLIAGGLLQPKGVSFGAAETSFVAQGNESARAELGGVQLDAASVPPPDAKRITVVPADPMLVVVRVVATGAAADLLSLRVGPLGAKTKGAGSFAYSKRVEVAG